MNDANREVPEPYQWPTGLRFRFWYRVEKVRLAISEWWVTYVQMSRAERRRLVEIINNPDAEYVEVERPS